MCTFLSPPYSSPYLFPTIFIFHALPSLEEDVTDTGQGSFEDGRESSSGSQDLEEHRMIVGEENEPAKPLSGANSPPCLLLPGASPAQLQGSPN